MKKVIALIVVMLCFTTVLGSCFLKDGAAGTNGKSAYEIAVEQGFVGTEDEWIASLKPNSIIDVTVDYMGKVVITLSDGTVHEIEVTDTSCTHDFDVNVVAPTCGEDGLTTFTCKNCEYKYSNARVEKTGHRFFERYCAFCGTEEQFGEIEYDTSWYDNTKYEFEISTREQLVGVAYLVNTGAENFANKTLTLTASIDLLADEWTPIGTEENPFAGTVNGRGFSISNLKLNKAMSYVGFFGYSLGEIKNIDFKGANVTVSGTNSSVGIACGYSTKAISGVTASGYVTAVDCDYVGGVVGKCDNSVNASASSAEVVGSNFVGGVAGSVIRPYNMTYTSLSNSGKVTGAEYVGGIFGCFNETYSEQSAAYTVKMNDITNSGEISGGDYTGGLFGKAAVLYTKGSSNLEATDFSNTGNVTGGYYVGGLFGFINSSDASYVKDSASSAAIVGKAYVGGLIGYCDYATLADSTNEGTTVSATHFSSVATPTSSPDGSVYAYLGGYIGSGDDISNCTNNADIIYNLEGLGVGGIAGRANSGIKGCTNNGNIKSVGSNVGGVAGRVLPRVRETTYSVITNSGRIEGVDKVGGIFGSSETYVGWWDGTVVTYINDMTNTGNVYGVNEVAGTVGLLVVNNSSDYGYSVLRMTNFTNSGNISGFDRVGELFGKVTTDGKSTLKVYSSLGQIVKDGDTLVGDYLVGASSGLTITEQ